MAMHVVLRFTSRCLGQVLDCYTHFVYCQLNGASTGIYTEAEVQYTWIVACYTYFRLSLGIAGTTMKENPISRSRSHKLIVRMRKKRIIAPLTESPACLPDCATLPAFQIPALRFLMPDL